MYNIIAAYAAARLCSFELADINDILAKYKPQTGRMQQFNIGKNVILNLVKNSAGFNQTISTLLNDKRKKDIIIAINDNAQDGKDVSWLWDVQFKLLDNAQIGNIITSSIRCDDVSVCLKYFGLENVKKVCDIKGAITQGLKTENDVLYIIVNYTALFSAKKILDGDDFED